MGGSEVGGSEWVGVRWVCIHIRRKELGVRMSR